MLNLDYASPAVMKEILPELVNRDRADRVGLQLFPVVPEPTYHVRWTQRDNFYGLMQMRGLDGAPPKIQRVGMQTFVYEPGVYGEYGVITEREILTRMAPTRPDLPIPITDLVAEYDMLMVARLNDRMEANVWNLLANGQITIPLPGPNGVQVYKDSYTIQQYTAPVPWGTFATATPLANFQTIQQFQVGHGVDFGASATAYMNQFTANLLLNNSNTADYAGRRDQFGATLNDIGAFNNYFQGQNLPRVQVYDAGYQINPISGIETTPATQFQKFIPNRTVIVVGKRPGNAPVGEWKQTLQAMQPGAAPAPGEYHFIKDYARGINAPLEVPPKVEIHRGFNGGLTLLYGSAVISMSV